MYSSVIEIPVKSSEIAAWLKWPWIKLVITANYLDYHNTKHGELAIFYTTETQVEFDLLKPYKNLKVKC